MKEIRLKLADLQRLLAGFSRVQAEVHVLTQH